MRRESDYEVAIIGGGPAGLSAALILGRSRRRVVIFDAGSPRNAPADAAHNLYTRDGESPLTLNRIAREQLGPYTSVDVRAAHVADADRLDDGTYVVVDADGHETTADQLILATGVVDDLPEVPGLRELWGSGVFHCPFCHGWEVQDEPFVLLAQDPRALHGARVLRGWTANLTLCTVGSYRIPEDERQALSDLGVRVGGTVSRLVGGPNGRVTDVVLDDETHLGPAAVFTSAPIRQRSPLPEKLGAKVHTEGMFMGMIQVDPRGFAGVPGLWVVGDASQGMPQVVSAAADGTVAGAMINVELLGSGRLPRGPR